MQNHIIDSENTFALALAYHLSRLPFVNNMKSNYFQHTD